jgi:HEAT repeat protein
MFRRSRDETSTEALIEATESGGPLQRLSAVVMLSERSGADVAAALSKALLDRRWFVRRAAARSLGRVDPKHPLDQVLGRQPETQAHTGSDSLSAEEIVRRGLWDFEEANAVETFSERIEAKDPLRGLYAELLGEIGDPKAVPALVHAIRDENASVRTTAAEALGKIRTDESLDALIVALADENRKVRKAAHHALVSFGESARAALTAASRMQSGGSAEAAAALRDLDR